eukprot:CAMPEP_0181213716 /NCGR_PEP_ID=MMETSP1096-20121128/25057_1 /TAXON_ID=156174 ORGANISM="Chrysochromulina ericina, Strain CCMP281" /NCGR_SAMPLE_ID=MMETSP1096 /ASSEMBLY_ACC=CAM_ASM_000453 /LENGTH=125 /DNA_ID=CAMNT_0023305381 /DNA_START=74 /DNA_END=451 /DNA_ORIENTATION=-
MALETANGADVAHAVRRRIKQQHGVIQDRLQLGEDRVPASGYGNGPRHSTQPLPRLAKEGVSQPRVHPVRVRHQRSLPASRPLRSFLAAASVCASVVHEGAAVGSQMLQRLVLLVEAHGDLPLAL